MNLTKSTATLISVASGIVSIAFYSILTSFLNEDYRIVGGVYEHKEALLGFDLPVLWHLGKGTDLPISIFFGIFIGVVVAATLVSKVESKYGEK